MYLIQKQLKQLFIIM